MKKVILLSIFALLVLVGRAQHATGSLTVQPKVGINLASYAGGEGDRNILLGGVVGPELEYQISDIVSLSVGLLYSMQGVKSNIITETIMFPTEPIKPIQGAKGTTITDIKSVDATLKVNYFNVPVVCNVYVAKGFAVKLGIQPGFKLDSKLMTSNNGVSSTADLHGMKSVDFSIPVGLSYEFNNFVVDARYNWGVSKAVEKSNIKNSVLQFTFGYKFALQ